MPPCIRCRTLAGERMCIRIHTCSACMHTLHTISLSLSLFVTFGFILFFLFFCVFFLFCFFFYLSLCFFVFFSSLSLSDSLWFSMNKYLGKRFERNLRPTSACHGQETSWCIHHLWQWGYRILLNLQYSQFRALPLGPIQDVIPGFCDDDCVDERTLAFRKFMYQNGFEEARHFFGPRYDSLAKWTRELLALLSWSSCLCRAYGMPNIAGCYCTKQGGWRDSSGLPWTRDT